MAERRRKPLPLCGCGCGQPVKRHGRTYLRGHYESKPPIRKAKERPYEFFDKGKKRWYIALPNGKKMARYRQVMEKHLGRALRPGEVVHHINGDSSDDRLENLRYYSSNSEHIRTAHSS